VQKKKKKSTKNRGQRNDTKVILFHFIWYLPKEIAIFNFNFW